MITRQEKKPFEQQIPIPVFGSVIVMIAAVIVK